MKTIFLTMGATLALATMSMAGGTVRPEPRPEPIYAEARQDLGVELSFTTSGIRDIDDLGDMWSMAAGMTVLEYDLGAGRSELFLFGEFGDHLGNEYGTLGAEYTWTLEYGASRFALATEAAYVMMDDFDNGAWMVTPNLGVEIDFNNTVTGFGELGYTWDASNDWSAAGGYSQLGLDIGLTNQLSLRPSVVQPFDSVNDDIYAEVEIELRF